jgi:GMP synthase-like glutamine amidotransferase
MWRLKKALFNLNNFYVCNRSSFYNKFIVKKNYSEKCKINIYKNVHLFFYSYINNSEINLLLGRNNNNNIDESHTFGEIKSDISDFFCSPNLEISKTLIENFKGLFSDGNLKKLSSNDEIQSKDLSGNNEWYEMANNNFFYEMVMKLSNNPIQLDTIPGKISYFVEIPPLDTNFLNKNLNQLGINWKFKYFNEQNYKPADDVNLFKFISENKNKSISDHYIVLSCQQLDAQKFDNMGFYMYLSLFPGLFRRGNDEKWMVYSPYTGEFPDDSILQKTKAIVIPGSHQSAYENFEYMWKIEDFIKNTVINKHKHIKIMGICFGHQIFSKINLSEIGKKLGNRVQEVEEIGVDEKFWNFKFVKNSGVEKMMSFKAMEDHGDEVKTIPLNNNMKLYGSSKSCKNEIFVSDDERFFTIQSHPEFTPKFLVNLLMAGHEDKNNVEKVKEEYLRDFKRKGNDNHYLKSICYSFLKYY